MVEQHTRPPESLWEALWPLLAPALTYGTVMGIVVTIALTHALKQLSAVYMPDVTSSLLKWRAHCTILSILSGTLVGVAIWLSGGANLAAVPIIALGSGMLWRLALVFLPVKVADTFLTDTDKSFRDDRQC